MTWSLVGTIGTATQGASAAAITPAFGTGESRTAGNLLILFVSGMSTTAADHTLPAAPSGWLIAKQISAASNATSSIFYKVAAGGDSAPTVAGLAGTLLAGQLAEYNWSVGGQIPTLEQTASAIGTTTNPLVATAGTADAAAGNLVLAAISVEYAAAATKTITHTLNNGATTTQAGNNNATSSREHYNFAYGITTGHSGGDSSSVAVATTSAEEALVLVSFKAVTPTTTTVAEVELEAPPDGTPTTQTNHQIVAHARTASSATDTVLNVALYQGATEITSATLTSAALTSSFAQYTFTILDADAADITDYTNLRIRFWGTSVTGDTSTVEISQLVLVTPDGTGGGPVDGAASFSATGTFTATAKAAHVGSLSTAATGSFTASAKVAHTGAVNLAATGSLTAAGTVATAAPSVSFSGTGTFTASGNVAHKASASFSATGSLTATGKAAHTGSLSTSATGSFTAAGSVVGAGPAVEGAVSYSGTGTFTAAGSVASASVTGAVSFSATGSLTATAKAAHTGVASFSATGSLTSSAKVAHTGSASFSGTGSLTATGKAAHNASASFSGTGSFSASGKVAHTASVSFSATGSFTAVPEGSTIGHASFSATGTFSCSGNVKHTGSLSLHATGSLAASSTVKHRGAVSFSATGTFLAGSAPLPNIFIPTAVMLEPDPLVVDIKTQPVSATMQGSFSLASMQGKTLDTALKPGTEELTLDPEEIGFVMADDD